MAGNQTKLHIRSLGSELRTFGEVTAGSLRPRKMNCGRKTRGFVYGKPTADKNDGPRMNVHDKHMFVDWNGGDASVTISFTSIRDS